jgi:membrane-associated phospholipid phosphatase
LFRELERNREAGRITWNSIRLLILLAAVATLTVDGTRLISVLVSLILVATGIGLFFVVERSQYARLWATFVLGIVLFTHLRTLADRTFIPVRFEYVIDLDRLLFLGHVPTIWLQERLYDFGNPSALDLLMLVAYVSYFPVPYLLAVALWFWNREQFPLYIVGVLFTYYLGLVIYYLVPTAPPWLASFEGYLPDVYRIPQDIFTDFDELAYEQGHRVVGENDVAAMPSLHFATTVIVALMLWRLHWIARYFGAIYAGLMGFSLVYLGEHYATDVIAGAVVAAVAWWAAIRWIEQLSVPSLSARGSDRGTSTSCIPDS